MSRAPGHAWAHEVYIRRPSEVPGYRYDEFVQESISEMDLRS